MKKIVFMGTPKFSVKVLQMLIDNYDVVLVVCQPDKEIGRKKQVVYSPIKELALENNIEVYQPNSIKNDYEKILSVNPDIIITCAYGQFIPSVLLNYPKFGSINVHASLLPELRGGAPIHKAIINGLKKTGITIMYMGEKMDNGDIIDQKSIDILDDDTHDTLQDKLSSLGSKLLEETLKDIFASKNKRFPQDETKVTFGMNIKREEEHIDFNKSTKEIYNHIRGLNSIPGAYAVLDDNIIKLFDCHIGTAKNSIPGQIIQIYKDGIGISTLDGEIIITSLQVQGKKKMNVKDYLNGVKKENLLNKIFK